MSDAEPNKKSLKKRVADRLHPPPSEEAQKVAQAAAQRASLAMQTLVDLLSSQDEGIRLKAAQIILDYAPAPAAASSPPAAVQVMEKLSKKL